MFLGLIFIFSNCSTYLIVADPISGSEINTHKKTIRSTFWGLRTEQLNTECNVSHNCKDGSISKISIKSTFTQTLVSIVTLGIISNTTVTYSCCYPYETPDDVN